MSQVCAHWRARIYPLVHTSLANKMGKARGGGSTYVEAQYCATLRGTLELLHWTGSTVESRGLVLASQVVVFLSRLEGVPHDELAFPKSTY